MRWLVEFPGAPFEPLDLPDEARLSEHLTALNSPALFGCRTGICGTCLVEIEPVGVLPPAERYESEALALYAPGNHKARLACQVRLRANIRLRKIAAL